MAKHNKKRNVGLIHEQLVRYASEKIVVGQKENAEHVMSILNEHFKDDSHLYREFRLFNALVHTRVQNRDTARRIIEESKTACKNHDDNQLRAEKSRLIKAINHDLDQAGFYSRKIPEYKVYATVQTLLNEWRGDNRLSPAERVKYECVLEEWLTRDPSENTLSQNSKANPLAFKIMIEKFNKKYSTLNKDQARLLELKLLGDISGMKDHVSRIKTKAGSIIENFYHTCSNEVLLEKRALVEKKIYEIKESADDVSVKQALVLSALIQEMEDNDE